MNLKNDFLTVKFNISNQPFTIINTIINEDLGKIEVFNAHNTQVAALRYSTAKNTAFIENISVNSKFRNLGIGTHLITYFEQFAKINNFDFVMAYFNTLVCNSQPLSIVLKRKHFYEKLNYELIKDEVLKDITIIKKPQEKFCTSDIQKNIKFEQIGSKQKNKWKFHLFF